MNDAQKKALEARVPPEQIYKKPGKNLDYVKGGWVKQRMNEIFGPDGWSWTIISFEADRLENKEKDVYVVRVHGRLIALGAQRDALAAGTGYGADGWHSAMGEADTDALKRAASALGLHLGGELYLDEDDERRQDWMSDDDLKRILHALESAQTPAQIASAGKRAQGEMRAHRVTEQQQQVIEAALEASRARFREQRGV